MTLKEQRARELLTGFLDNPPPILKEAFVGLMIQIWDQAVDWCAENAEVEQEGGWSPEVLVYNIVDRKSIRAGKTVEV